VVGRIGAAALARWAAVAQARVARARPAGRDVSARDPAAGEAPHPLGTRLVGAPAPLTLLSSVRPGTVAVVLRAGRLPVARQAGELLLPQLLTRQPAAVRSVVLSTAPVHVHLTVTDLASLDGYPVEPARLRLRLQLLGDHVTLPQLVAEHQAGLETVLLEEVRQQCAAAVRGAVAVNRRADLQRLTLRRVLGDRWLPPSFLGGVVLCREVSVLAPPDRHQEPHEQDEQDEPTLVLSAGEVAAALQPDTATAEAAPMAAQS